jgi:UDP-N-acetylmuramoyl-tripeptide--D-alanyl-D-alanine ligase
MQERYQGAKQITFSLQDPSADIYLQKGEGEQIRGKIGSLEGEARFTVFGSHNLMNLAAACAMAYAYQMPAPKIWEAINHCKTIWGRNQWVELKGGAKVVFDAYNANPDSMNALLENIENLKSSARKFLVLGDMLEIGEESLQEHQKIAQKAAAMDFQKVYFIGKQAAHFKAAYGKENLMISNTYKESLAKDLGSMLDTNDIVFMKASRSIRLEKFLQALDPLNFESK